MQSFPVWWSQAMLAVEQSGIGATIRSTPYLYPVLMSVHVLGIALLVGSALSVDLRLLGIAHHAVPVSTVTRYLLPLSRAGFLIVASTGAGMFVAIAVTVGESAAAPWKLSLIALAGVNIGVFHAGVYRSVAKWDLHAVPPMAARAAAVVSAASWIGAIFAGRFLSY